MPLYLTEDNVTSLLTMSDAIDTVEAGFKALAEGQASNVPRTRLRLPNGAFNMMSAAAPGLGVMGLKAYGAGGGRRGGFHVQLSSTETGELLAIMEASALGQIRTGAASGVATRHMARDDASTVGVIGAGYQSRSQLEAVCGVRDVGRVKVFSPTKARRDAYASEMGERLGVEVVPVGDAELFVGDSDIVLVMTNASEPVIQGEWIGPGTHVNAAGANSQNRRELDIEAVRRADVVAVDDIAQAKTECGDLLSAVDAGVIRWEHVRGLADVIGGVTPGRKSPNDVTLFESQGIAIEDIAVAKHVYEQAKLQGVGVEL
ncbi:MAG: ornithine cyclodeaminase family protein [SAR202 cluster bacterium]|nr:ornithine cyclodeaminase [Chloroflexota bacterium]MDP6422177.1 ornithine cyclodeaminase family protein [SAR202 cluster bacterium]HAL49368.1 ornithine cyclodeaminase [Dehalococcoidia bacterium]MDP6663468.1 ornithine cyclodeaminase family protein [SAR202 cluster bacterium]MQG58714.1 ornithine cyclodeaminase family protein [SAR202 cluster bacterium]